ncbi:DUF58 domain-containing protein [Azospirillum brasilense]|uniref:DUF58 domain-containing protein n=1 Tax=Azospirillum brasilense TaxID=192 RepID=UPI000E6A14E3|nr:DUF58 domain-containing protein [Azospirillum brasilense]NUB24366.1 DUF58 domain-containing protein [Azospirillum brasilense]NUB30803.1 DUF58 domain-containing protein [Azospirillum brasilense]RIW02611.1 DUF58 domain-containing protein [Azospirillum brasilense]
MATQARAYITLDDLLRLRHRAKGFSFLPKQPVHSLLAGRHASRLRGRGLEFEELRPYYEGDDVRAIDWRATARLGAPQLRVYTEERDRPVILLVDQRLSMFFGSRRATKSVVAAEAAALAAWRVTSLGDRIGGIVFSENGVDEIRPRARQAAIGALFEAIARHNRALRADDPRPADPGLLNIALAKALRLLPHDGLLTILTDAAGADDETVRLVTQVTAHNDVLVVFVFDPLEAELPDIGRTVIAEGSRQIEIDSSAKGVRSRFADRFAQRREAVESVSRRRAIPVLPLSTGRDTSEQFRELLGRRLARSADPVRRASAP